MATPPEIFVVFKVVVPSTFREPPVVIFTVPVTSVFNSFVNPDTILIAAVTLYLIITTPEPPTFPGVLKAPPPPPPPVFASPAVLGELPPPPIPPEPFVPKYETPPPPPAK